MHRNFIHSILPITSLFMSMVSFAQQPKELPSVNVHTRISINVYEYDFVDRQPEFPGGNNELIRFINQERRYPQDAYREGIEGRVLCSFVVNEDGTLSHISVIKGVEESLNKEAVRIISQMPPWLAGAINNTPVPVYCILPIPFRK
ncbi:MAG: energy transducer TonB [Duncaniella sp.]|nr:energy transducer TonB [Muribaculum sp.]MCM1254520.1 energy transducer TonB [Duncaniella sp.]